MSKTMLAIVKKNPEKGLSLEEVKTKEPLDDEVQIKVAKASICGTDLHIYNWDDFAKNNIKPPQIIGHEYCGHIVKLGKNVKGLKEGDLVTSEGHIVCNSCRNCRAGRWHLCKDTLGLGVNIDGAFAQYVNIKAANIWKVSDNFDKEILSIFDPFGNATHTALTYDVFCEDVLITGAGPIGIMAALISLKAGARNVVLTDINEYRLNLAKSIDNRIYTVNPTKKSLKEVMQEINMREGFDIGLEMSGVESAFNDMIKHMITGGKIALLGIHGAQTKIDWNKIVLGSITLTGIYGRRMFETWYKMTVMIEEGLNIKSIITHRFKFNQFEEAFQVMLSGKSGKVILDWE